MDFKKYQEYINNPDLLTDEQITGDILPNLRTMALENINCSENDKTITTSSGCFFVSAHGNDLEVGTNVTIVDAIMSNIFEIDSPDGTATNATNYPDLLVSGKAYRNNSEFRRAFEKYITESMYIQIALGLPGPSAPMSGADVGLYEKGDIIPSNQTQNQYVLSTSELDIAVVANSYRLLKDFHPPSSPFPTKCDLIEFNKVIRHQLRANFIKIWDEERTKNIDPDEYWTIHYLKLLEYTQRNPNKPQIWVLKRLNKFSNDRYYQLEPKEDEPVEFRVHEGLHLFDLRNNDGQEIPDVVNFDKFSKWKKSIEIKSKKLREATQAQITNDDLDFSNLKDSDFRKTFKEYVQTLGLPPAKIAAIERILLSIEKKQLYLSEICLLGFLLDIKMLTLFDPACRPLTSSSLTEASTRTGAFYKGFLYGSAAKKYDTLLEELSQPIQ